MHYSVVRNLVASQIWARKYISKSHYNNMEPLNNNFHAQRYISITDSYKSERWCDDCWLLKHLCICGELSQVPLSSPISFHLFIHYKEYKRTSNTGILLKKLLPSSGKYIAGIEEDTQRLISTLEGCKNVCVMYPGEKSMDLSEWVQAHPDGEKHFILLDSTWNQGRKLLKSLPDTYDRVKIQPVAPSLIKCKKQTNKGFLSTLECAAYILKELGEESGYESLMKAFVLKDKAALKQTHKHWVLKTLEETKHYDASN